MIWRVLGATVVALTLTTSVARAAVPAGPRLAVVEVSVKPPRLEVVTVNRNGGDSVRLAGGGRRARPLVDFFSPLSWFPDGSKLAFSGIVRFEKGDDHEAIQKIFTVGADGHGLRAIRGTKEAVGPVVSPDGRIVAFTRAVDRETPTTVGGRSWKEGFHGSSIWIVDLQTGVQRQLTPWRDGLDYVASSFSPDGSTLLATFEDPLLLNESQPVALELDGSGSRRIAEAGGSPVYSPDGSRIVFVRRIEEYGENRGEDTDLYVVGADGSGLRRLTRTPGQPEFSPSWDPSGERIAYVRLPLERSGEAPFDRGVALMQINADGSCKTRIPFSRLSLTLAPAWQPGPGREAGRIGC